MTLSSGSGQASKEQGAGARKDEILLEGDTVQRYVKALCARRRSGARLW